MFRLGALHLQLIAPSSASAIRARLWALAVPASAKSMSPMMSPIKVSMQPTVSGGGLKKPWSLPAVTVAGRVFFKACKADYDMHWFLTGTSRMGKTMLSTWSLLQTIADMRDAVVDEQSSKKDEKTSALGLDDGEDSQETPKRRRRAQNSDGGVPEFVTVTVDDVDGPRELVVLSTPSLAPWIEASAENFEFLYRKFHFDEQALAEESSPSGVPSGDSSEDSPAAKAKSGVTWLKDRNAFLARWSVGGKRKSKYFRSSGDDEASIAAAESRALVHIQSIAK